MNSLLPEGARSTLPPCPCPTVSSSHAALAVTTFWDVYSPPSDLICYLSVEHGDELAMNPSLRFASITHFSPSAAPIHPSSWNRNSANFAFWGFCEVRIHGVLRSPLSPDPQTLACWT